MGTASLGEGDGEFTLHCGKKSLSTGINQNTQEGGIQNFHNLVTLSHSLNRPGSTCQGTMASTFWCLGNGFELIFLQHAESHTSVTAPSF